MLQLLAGFAALSLICSALMNLLPDGSIRHAASMAAGLLMLLYWAQGLQGLLEAFPDVFTAPSTVLTSTGVTLERIDNAFIQEEMP